MKTAWCCVIGFDQELDRLNCLLEKMSQSLKDLLHALRGEIGMSADLDELTLSLQTGFLPTQWRAFAPQSLKPLASWLAHLMRRIGQYNDWIAEVRDGTHSASALGTALLLL